MQRRTFLSLAGAGAASAAAAPKKAVFVLTAIRMRQGPDRQAERTAEFLATAFAPAVKRTGAGPVGLFGNLIGEQSPTIHTLVSYPSLADLEAGIEKLAQDADYQKRAEAYYSAPGLAYQRFHSSLLRAFDSMPAIEPPPTAGRPAARIFELRTYESNNLLTLRRKIKMLDDGEIAIFRRLGMSPVFFGQTLIGGNMPSLTYMLAFDNLAAREKAWQAFSQDAEWQKMRVQPGLSDAEIVSNISNSILRPLPGSDIR
jgi:hypothetical protein